MIPHPDFLTVRLFSTAPFEGIFCKKFTRGSNRPDFFAEFENLHGSSGNGDTLIGGDGPDQFTFVAATESRSTARDMIADFETGADVLALSGIDASVSLAGDQAFTFIGSAALSGSEGELRFITNGTDGFILGDVNGDGIQDLEIRLPGVSAMDVGDFIL